MSDQTPNAELPAAPESAAAETSPEVAATQNPAPEGSEQPPEAVYQPPVEALVDSTDTSTLPVALRPCPAGPAHHPRTLVEE